MTGDPVAEIDQAVATLRSLAEAAVVLHRTLRDGGLPDQLAATMTLQWWTAFVVNMQTPKGDA